MMLHLLRELKLNFTVHETKATTIALALVGFYRKKRQLTTRQASASTSSALNY